MQDKIESLKKLLDESRKLSYKISDKISLLEDVPRAKALVGQCFKYSNAYSHTEVWWLYMKVIKQEGCLIVVDQFEEDVYGKVTFEFDRKSSPDLFSAPRHISISLKEYNKAKKKLINKLAKRVQKGV